MFTFNFFGGILFLFILSIICDCKPNNNLKPNEGYIPVTGGKVWYKIVGEGNKTPILLLHGGPGVPSDYLNPLASLAKDRPVIFFDQLGCGRSDRITDSSLLSIENFVEQVETVRKTLGLKEFILYGQSWGTTLGVEYYFKYPDKVKALILSSPLLSTNAWLNDARVLISTLPDSIQKAIRVNEKNKTYDSPEYQEAIQIYYKNFVARKLPWSDDLNNSMANTGVNVYQTMWGQSEFTAAGILKNYDCTLKLGNIKVPTLFICGEFDEATPATVKHYQSLTPGSKFVEIKNSAHLTMHDNPTQDLESISKFLDSIGK